ncbi:PorT family protein [Flavobacteriaceae bacterium]|nr:PorT family protein [Flavobacteriaceae bacterium]
MKKLFIITMTLAAFTLQAQDVTFGAKAGLNFATLDITDSNIDGRTSFHLGITAEFEMSDTFSIQSELLYSAQGATEDAGETIGTTVYNDDYKFKLNYLQIPVMAKFYVSEDLSLEVGPQIGFLLSADVENDYSTIDNGTVLDSGSTEIDYKDFMKSVDFGLNFGLGYKLDSGLNFGLRYNLGLNDVYDVDGSNVEIKNRVLQLSVGYNF